MRKVLSLGLLLVGLVFVLFIGNVSASFCSEPSVWYNYFNDYSTECDGWDDGGSFNLSNACDNSTSTVIPSESNPTKLVYEFNSTGVIYGSPPCSRSTPVGAEWRFAYGMRTRGTEYVDVRPQVTSPSSEQGSWVNNIALQSNTPVTAKWTDWYSMNSSFTFDQENFTWDSFDDLRLRLSFDLPLSFGQLVYLYCAQIKVWYVHDVNESRYTNGSVNVSLENGSYVWIEYDSWFNDTDFFEDSLETVLSRGSFYINESAYQIDETMNNTGFYNFSLDNESWANISWFSWFNDSDSDTLETVLTLTAQYINNSVGSGCSFPFWFNYSDDNITINVTVSGCGTASLSDSSINENDWLFIAGLELDPQVFIILLVAIWFWFAEQKNDFVLYILAGVSSLVGGLWFLLSEATDFLSFTTWTGVLLMLFGVYCSFLALWYGMVYQGRKK